MVSNGKVLFQCCFETVRIQEGNEKFTLTFHLCPKKKEKEKGSLLLLQVFNILPTKVNNNNILLSIKQMHPKYSQQCTHGQGDFHRKRRRWVKDSLPEIEDPEIEEKASRYT